MKNSSPVIFLPGLTCDERVWFPCWKQMDIANRAYVPLQWAETLEQMLALTGDRVDEYGSPAHLVGFSMGGYAASQYTIANPQHVASLTLVGYNAEGLSAQELESRQSLIKAIENNTYKPSKKQVLQQYIHTSKLSDESLTDYVNGMNEDLGAGVLKAHIKATTPRPSLLSKLASLNIPIHIVAADDDFVAPLPRLKHMHANFKCSTLSVINNAAHMMLVEQPQECAQVIEQFLSVVDQ